MFTFFVALYDCDCVFRLTWQRVRALQMFAEKVYIPHASVTGMVFIIRRLEMVSVCMSTLSTHYCIYYIIYRR